MIKPQFIGERFTDDLGHPKGKVAKVNATGGKFLFVAANAAVNFHQQSAIALLPDRLGCGNGLV
jgi:hypothetical protein